MGCKSDILAGVDGTALPALILTETCGDGRVVTAAGVRWRWKPLATDPHTGGQNWMVALCSHEARAGFGSHSDVGTAVLMVREINNHLMVMRLPLKGKMQLTLISAYAPTMSFAQEQKELFYENLAHLLLTVPRHDKVLLMGDFNARVGSDSQSCSDQSSPSQPQMHVSKLSHPDTGKLLATKLREQIKKLPTESNPEKAWKNFRKVIYGTSKRTLGHIKRKHQDWFDNNNEEITSLLWQKQEALTSWLNDKNSTAKHKHLRSKVQTCVTLEVRQHHQVFSRWHAL
ncbi:hypothetical protein Bbelb_393320 [Branchiostoma belcheri]|nr:hypothetical protein Bbelb_393320 [Branchiostoma belcheri]